MGSLSAGCQHTGNERLQFLPGLKMGGLGGDQVLHTTRYMPLRPQRGGIELHHKDVLSSSVGVRANGWSIRDPSPRGSTSAAGDMQKL